jgi:hypothetical protein
MLAGQSSKGPEAMATGPLDWHKYGLWLMFDKDNQPVAETIATTPYSARAEGVRALNLTWSRLREQGFYISEIKAVGSKMR